MEKIDRLGWAEGMVFSAFGRHVGIRTNEPGLLERVPALLPPFAKPSDRERVRRVYSLRVRAPDPESGKRPKHVLLMNARVLERSTKLDYLLERLAADAQLYIAERARRRIFVHAGVVAFAGRAIVLPARTMCGKTTLVAELLAQGGTYYSDEYAVLDERGRVHPFPTELSVRSRSGRGKPKRKPASAWGAETGAKPVPVGLVALAQYREGARWRPRKLPEGRAVLSVLQHAVPARRRPKATLKTLQAALATAPVLKGVRGEAEATAQALIRRLKQESVGGTHVDSRRIS